MGVLFEKAGLFLRRLLGFHVIKGDGFDGFFFAIYTSLYMMLKNKKKNGNYIKSSRILKGSHGEGFCKVFEF